jgi:pimeloyl-ACP methyl ester carboxylesterase
LAPLRWQRLANLAVRAGTGCPRDEVVGEGPLVVLVPGMGDLRSTYRFLAPRLREAGYRVASADLRGHGDSDATFKSYGDAETAGDVAALVEQLGGPAVLVGNSMGAAAAVLVAAGRPDLVSALVLIGPGLRPPQLGLAMRLFVRVWLRRPWTATMWKAYLPRGYAGRRPADYDNYTREVLAALGRPGHKTALSRTSRLSHAEVETRLGQVRRVRALVLMGEKDPDFADPAKEAGWIGPSLQAEVVMVPDAGHYPQSQQPDVVTEAITSFLAHADADA